MNYYFIGLLVVCSVYAVAAGGAPERIAAAAYALSCLATSAILRAHMGSRWVHVELGVFMIDTIIFCLFCVLALRAERFWVIWASALLGLGVLGHLGRWYAPDLLWWAYAVVLTIWSYPILLLLAVGTWNHQQRLSRFGADKSWSPVPPCRP
jgi:hypothetical protein